MILFPLYPVICIMWFVPFHFHNGFLSSLMETYGDPFSLYRICPALMELRLDSGTYVCLDDSSFLVPFSFASYIIHRVKRSTALQEISFINMEVSRGSESSASKFPSAPLSSLPGTWDFRPQVWLELLSAFSQCIDSNLIVQSSSPGKFQHWCKIHQRSTDMYFPGLL